MKQFLCCTLVIVSLYGVALIPKVHAATSSDTTELIQLMVMVAKLQAQLSLLQGQNAAPTSATLSYQRRTNSVDEAISAYGVTVSYTSPSTCNAQLDDLSVAFGDGTSVLADCKGVVEHAYKKDGTYTATYTKNKAVVASVEVVIENSSDEATASLPAPLYGVPEVTATMQVASLGTRSILVTGVITPPQNCVGTE